MVFEKIKAILAEQLNIDEDSITMDSSIIEDLGADSIDLVDLMTGLEEEFDAELPEDIIEELKTVGDVVRYVEENLL